MHALENLMGKKILGNKDAGNFSTFFHLKKENSIHREGVTKTTTTTKQNKQTKTKTKTKQRTSQFDLFL